MESLFKGYYQPTPEQFEELWKEGTFVFDTNVLLGLYRYKEKSRNELLNIIVNIENRIWIPYQVGLEFHRGRLSVLARQNKDVDTIKMSIAQSIKSIENKCNELDLDKRHSEVETNSFIERFQDLADSVLTELSEIKPKNLTNNANEDEILNKISSLFNTTKSSLGSPPESQKVLDAIYKDGEFRAVNKIPPSYKDIEQANKNKNEEKYYSFNGLNYQHGYGDLIVWKQIIDFARENDKKNIIFVTDDKKEDWMRIIDSGGKKTISARPELVSEIFKEAGVEVFYVYDTNSFLDYSKEYFDIEVSDETIEDVRYTSDKKYTDRTKYTKKSYFVEDLWTIEDWVNESYLFTNESKNLNIYDFLAFDDFTSSIPVLVRPIAKIQTKILKNLFVSLRVDINNLLIEDPSYTGFHVVITVPEPSDNLFGESEKYKYFEKSVEIKNILNDMFDPSLNLIFTIGFTSKDLGKFSKILEYKINN